MARTYQVQEDRPNELPPIQHTYHGFNKSLRNARYVALVRIEADVEVFALDTLDTTGLELYLSQKDGYCHLIGIYERKV